MTLVSGLEFRTETHSSERVGATYPAKIKTDMRGRGAERRFPGQTATSEWFLLADEESHAKELVVSKEEKALDKEDRI